MNIEELKNKIENKTLDDSFMVWKIADESSYIIVNQYIEKIKEFKNCKVKYIDTFDDIPFEGFVVDTNLYILRADEWESDKTRDNCIILCKKAKNAIDFPKLEAWQLVDYALSLAPGIIKEDFEWLVAKYTNHYQEFVNLVKMLSAFNETEQFNMFKMMLEEGMFDNYTSFTVFDVSNAILQRNAKKVGELLTENIDMNVLGLAKILYNNFKNVLAIQTNPLVTANALGVSDKQLWAIKTYNCGFYSTEELIHIVEFLANIETTFKYKGVDMNSLLPYTIMNILGGCNG